MFEIKLHVYDLSQGMAAQFSRQLVGKHIEGVWHTGIVVFGKEYYFGGGISYDAPARTPFGQPTKVVDLGFTEIPEEMFMEYLKEISPRFTAETYHVFKHNCNNFTHECAQFLTGVGIPNDIIDLPNVFLNTPLGQMVGPMMQQMQDNLKVNSHQLFTNGGQQAPLQTSNPGFGAGPQGSQNLNDMNSFINQFANSMGGGGLGGGQMPIPQMQQQHNTSSSQQTHDSQSNGVIQISNLQQLQKLIKESPAVAVDFWSPNCGPCLRIKPTFESLAKANDNDNLKFAAVNTMIQRDCAMAFKITGIPDFRFFLNGNEFRQFKGAREDQLLSTLSELSELVKSKTSQHKNLNYKQFKPMNLAPQGFTSMANIEKMKEFIINFVKSEEVQKEVGSTENILKWLQGFKLESMPREAIDELMSTVEVAEDKNKIALIDLVRLLMMHEHSAAHILNKHWHVFEVSIFGYLECMDLKDPNEKVIQNYHLICLKMLGNIYQTNTGKDFMQSEEISNSLANFCTFSFDSVNPKVVFTSAVVLFNHLLCFRREKSLLLPSLQHTTNKLIQLYEDASVTDIEAVMGLLLCECRMVYQNKQLCELITEKMEQQFKNAHQKLELRVKDQKVREAIDDVFNMLFD